MFYCPNCDRPLEVVGDDAECAPCGIRWIGRPPERPHGFVDLAARRTAKESVDLGAAIGQLVHAIDVWEQAEKAGRSVAQCPSWALEARDQVVEIVSGQFGKAN